MRRGDAASVLLGVWQLATGVVTLAGGPGRSSSTRWDDVATLMGSMGAPVHWWAVLPLAGGVLVLAGHVLALVPLDLGWCRGARVAGHLAGVASAWVLGVSALLVAQQEPTAAWAAPVVYLALALPLSAWLAWTTARSLLRAVRAGDLGCAR